MRHLLTSALTGLILFAAACASPLSQQTKSANAIKKETATLPENGPEPTKGRILGIGGIFFKSPKQDEMREWYAKHLGLSDKGGGAMLHWREHDDPQKEQMTVWSLFPADTDYLGKAPFMINYIVDDMDAILARLEAEGVEIDPRRQNEDYGRFAWIYDVDGNKIELWQPPAAK